MSRGPSYLFCGSRLTDDRYVMRALLEGLNTMARQWQEKITIQDDGSLENLEYEVETFRYLEHQPVEEWSDPNVVFAFIDRMSHNRGTQATLAAASAAHRAAFVIRRYEGWEKIPQ